MRTDRKSTLKTLIQMRNKIQNYLDPYLGKSNVIHEGKQLIMTNQEFDKYNVDHEHEAQLLNEYYNSKFIHWEPVAKEPTKDKELEKLKVMKKFNQER